MVKENCGVVGIYSLSGTNVVPMVIDALRALQHRGQEAWGLAVPNKTPLKRLGLVSAASSEFKTISEEYASPRSEIEVSIAGKAHTRCRRDHVASTSAPLCTKRR